MWTPTTDPLDTALCGLWADDLDEYLASGYDFGYTQAVIRSLDGIAWTYQATPLDGGNGTACVRSALAGVTVVGGYDPTTPIYVTSPDHAAWTSHTNPFPGSAGSMNTLACKQSTGVVLAGATSGDENIAVSADALSFVSVTSPFDGISGVVIGIDYSPGEDRWIAAGLDNGSAPTVAYSDDDGANWTVIGTHPMTQIAGCYRDEANGRWYLLGQTTGANAAAYSEDGGATWTELSTPLDGVSGSATALLNTGADVLALGGYDNDTLSRLCVSLDAGVTWKFDEDSLTFLSGIRFFAYSASLGRAIAGGDG